MTVMLAKPLTIKDNYSGIEYHLSAGDEVIYDPIEQIGYYNGVHFELFKDEVNILQ